MRQTDATFVTGLWNIGREDLGDFHRKFDHYLECFEKLLSLDLSLYVYVPEELLDFVNSRRLPDNTYIHTKSLADLRRDFPHFNDVQRIRNDPNWYNLNGWLKESTQAKLEYYNPIVMSKMMMLNEASKTNWFNSKHLFWIDAGIANSVHTSFLSKLNKVEPFMYHIEDKFLMLSFDYESDYEVHGFKVHQFSDFCGVDKSNYVCRGGFFGGTPEKIEYLMPRYLSEMKKSFAQDLMGTEENFLTILAHKEPDHIHRFKLPDSLVYHFFDNLELFR